MTPVPRIARAPLTSKQPEACPYCGGHNVTRRGTRKKKLEIVQLWRCTACKRTFTPGPAALRNKTYSLRIILAALTDYDLGYTLQDTAARAVRSEHVILHYRRITTTAHGRLTTPPFADASVVDMARLSLGRRRRPAPLDVVVKPGGR